MKTLARTPDSARPLTALAIARLAFPNWKGRKAKFSMLSTVRVSGTCWEGGSRSEFVAVRLATMEVCALPPSSKTPREMGGTAPDQTVTVPEGYALVEHAFFCGTDTGCTVTLGAHPALPDPA